MRLKEYLEDSGYRTRWFSEQIPCSITYLCAIIAGKAKPSLIIRRRIEALTDGKVKEDEFEVTNGKG